MTTMNEHDESYHHHHHNDDEVCKDYDNETSRHGVSGNRHQQEQEDSSSSLEWLLQCPLSFERMQDPVVLFPSGHSYDRQFLCASLLHYPNLDPKSGIYYKEPLRYTTNYALRNVLQERDQLVPYDDSDFGAAYKQAWQDNNVGQQTNDNDYDLDDDNHGMGAAQHQHYRRRHYHRKQQQQQQQRSIMMRQIYQAAAVILLVTAISVGVCRAAAAERAAIQRARQCQLLRTWNPTLAWYAC